MKPMLRSFIVITFLITGLSAAAQKPTTALELNNYFATINDTLYASGREWGAELGNIYKNKDFSSLVPLRKKLELFITHKQTELQKMKDIGGSEEFRLAMLDFLAFENKMIKEAFVTFENLNNKSTDEEVKKTLDQLTELAKNENAVLQKVNAAQLKFAEKNGFTIEAEEDDN